VRAEYIAVAALALASLLLCLSVPPYPAFNEIFNRVRVEEFSRRLERALGLEGDYTRLVFFEVRGASICAFYADAARSMDRYRGKEWVVRLYDGVSLVYELRVDATLGFSSLYVNLTYVASDKALDTSITLIKGAEPGHFQLELNRALNLSCELPRSRLCSMALAEARRWRGVVALARMGFQALLLSSLIIAVVLRVPLPKVKLVLLTFSMLAAMLVAQCTLLMPYKLGKARAAPTLRAAFSVVYSGMIYSMLSSMALVAGLAIKAKTKPIKVPGFSDAIKSWCLGLALGVILAALSEILFNLFSELWLLLPLGAPVIEEALNSSPPWLELAVVSAASAIGEEIIFRFMLLLLFYELTRSKLQSVAISSVIFAVLYVPYPLYPAQAKLLQALAVAMILSLAYLRWGLLSAIFAHYTLDIISTAMTIYAIRPTDSLLLLMVLPLSLPLTIAALWVAHVILASPTHPITSV